MPQVGSIDIYNLARGLHILSVIAWMAGLLMLPRLYAYQAEAQPGGELEIKMIEAARRLRKIILTPAMIASWGFGLCLITRWHTNFFQEGWLIAKLVFVLGLTGLHGFCVAQGKKMAAGAGGLPSKTWRMLNEIPFVIAIAVVLLVVLKPF